MSESRVHLEIATAPFLQSGLNTRRLMYEVLGASMLVVVASVWFFGLGALLVGLDLIRRYRHHAVIRVQSEAFLVHDGFLVQEQTDANWSSRAPLRFHEVGPSCHADVGGSRNEAHWLFYI